MRGERNESTSLRCTNVWIIKVLIKPRNQWGFHSTVIASERQQGIIQKQTNRPNKQKPAVFVVLYSVPGPAKILHIANYVCPFSVQKVSPLLYLPLPKTMMKGNIYLACSFDMWLTFLVPAKLDECLHRKR